MKRWFTFSSVLIGTQAQASIPTNNDPTQGGSDNILELIYNYAYDILLYGGGMFIAFCFIYFLGHMWDLYSKTRERQATKKDLLSDGIIGAVLLLLSIWGLNYGLDILKGV
ncbi:TIGR03745 family integrating conjugative element membrane protein [Vibrio parahaemolyticus]|uniref:TIGR03745 family integrating conjugative element membrane protein n=1 Tax=Vibrio parahaemolyticus TaxID=670 RepID=A0AAX1G0M5_VIBPH|nr:TIGR03745 family integrating conjugative element membrane protein [Vibrio parahaemolyticus]QLK49694.1 TIGR03745 family integrating conjugative element membrane protein [Vibrio owensii]OUD67519.1 integrating conjugative element membrane protein [Vibrio parahaemolyticus]OUD68407.1 integrating conjugative element membrane protein [Vibrio parahaemolyticus]QHH13201.1 TIGR03745 family integrating conjugative element membrane protein [Vibrio parahaemolyticus]QNE59031.1 TIGR03745 family integrating